MEDNELVQSVCNGRACFNCPIFSFCIKYTQDKEDSLEVRESKFYSAAAKEIRKLQTV